MGPDLTQHRGHAQSHRHQRCSDQGGPSRLWPMAARTCQSFPPMNYEPVTVMTKDGQTVDGVMRNQDAFSVQLMDMDRQAAFLPTAAS